MPREAPRVTKGAAQESAPQESAPQGLVDAMCAFCETNLGSDVFAVHTCHCMQCGDPVQNWRLREDTPPLCDPCMLGIGSVDDSDDLDLLGDDEHMVRG